EAVDRAYRGAGRVGAVHAGHRDRALAGFAVVDRDDAAAVDAPRHLVLVLAGRDAGVALDAAVGIAEEFHPRHLASPPYAAWIWAKASCCNSASHGLERVSAPPPSYSTMRPEDRISGNCLAMFLSTAAFCTLKPIFGMRNSRASGRVG